MADVCFVITCMGRLAHLRETLGLIAALPRANCVLVDYSCPEGCGDWAERSWPAVRVVRVPGESRFQVTRARNIGARAADAPWVCFIDADVAVAPTFTEVLTPLLTAGHYYRPDPRAKELSGTVVCALTDFDRVGGYDEAIHAWGEEDVDLYARLELLGLAARPFPGELLRPIPHGDDLRVRFYDTKEKSLSLAVNALYVNAKLDLMRLSGRALSLAERRELYRRVSDWVGEYRTGKVRNGELRLRFARQEFQGGMVAVSYLTYSLRRNG